MFSSAATPLSCSASFPSCARMAATTATTAPAPPARA
eukprot:CAMPEP_0182854902 /NCGR_PEP_ID=MMETSP0034_2-20130328/1535_1 /TAXON_ID=156128 /ORGANISM="Nephroselmis pyriformis, Strain CCMP717" /LENGTH=36 /DNA_ID= /DNA_START= /DNA_END= /DNA_ORIENTATION=